MITLNIRIMKNLIIYIIPLILFYEFGFTNGLRWARTGSLIKLKTMSLKAAIHSINVDIYYEQQIVIVRDIQLWNYTLTIDCFITNYNLRSAISYSFCKNNDPCKNFKDEENFQSFKEFNLEGFIETNIGDRKGFRIHLKIPNKYEDTSGHYFCKVDNDKYSIRSNIVEIRDVFYWERKIFTKVESSFKSAIKTITIPSLPTIMNCSDGNSRLNPLMPVWSRLEFHHPCRWSVCPVLSNYNQLSAMDRMSAERCLSYTGSQCDNKINARICPRDLASMAAWKVYVTERGDLIFMDLPYEGTQYGDTYLLMCYTKNVDGDLQAITYFLEKKNDVDVEIGVAIDFSQRTFSLKLEAISPVKQNVVIYWRQARSGAVLNPVAIYGLYRASSSASFTWKRNSVNINSNNFMSVSRYMVSFDNEITASQAGLYSLEVVDGTDKLTMEINVKVLGPPVVVYDQCMTSILYTWAQRNLTITCQYYLEPRTLKVLINSQEIHLNDSLTTSRSQLRSSYINLSELSFTVSSAQRPDDDSIALTYTALLLAKEDHSVTFLAANDYGTIVKSTSIYVLPALDTIIAHYPDQDNCTSICSGSVAHKFRCDVRVQDYENKELVVDHYWMFNDHKLGGTNNMYEQYFKVDPKTKELTLSPITGSTPSDVLLRDLLNNTYVECHINLKSTVTNFVYASSLDMTLMTRMRARITMTPSTGLSQAGSHWIIGLVFGVLIAGIIIAVVAYYCRNIREKDKSSTGAKYRRTKASEDT